jgi:hypothetical protein
VDVVSVKEQSPDAAKATFAYACQRGWTVVGHDTDMGHLCVLRSRIRDDLKPKRDPVSTYDREKTGNGNENGNEKRRLELSATRSDTLNYRFTGKWLAGGGPYAVRIVYPVLN